MDEPPRGRRRVDRVNEPDTDQLTRLFVGEQWVVWRPGLDLRPSWRSIGNAGAIAARWPRQIGEYGKLVPGLLFAALAAFVASSWLTGGWFVLVLLAGIVLCLVAASISATAWTDLPWERGYLAWCRDQVEHARAEQHLQHPRCITTADAPAQQRNAFDVGARFVAEWHQRPSVTQGWIDTSQLEAAHRILWTAATHLRHAHQLQQRLDQARDEGLADTEEFTELHQMQTHSLDIGQGHLQALATAANELDELDGKLHRQRAHRQLTSDLEDYRGQAPDPVDPATSTEPLLAHVRAVQDVLHIDQPDDPGHDSPG